MPAETNPSSAPTRSWNWRIWFGFLVAIGAFVSYVTFFVKFPVTRNVPWVNWLLFAFAAYLLWTGISRSLRQPTLYRGKIVGPILAVLSLGIAVFFGFMTLYATRHLPASARAPKVGSQAPDFALQDTTGKTFTLAALLSDPMPGISGPGAKPRGVILIFYRGYW